MCGTGEQSTFQPTFTNTHENRSWCIRGKNHAAGASSRCAGGHQHRRGNGNARALAGILQLARRYDLSSYGASYLELAMREDLPLATLDEDLRRAAKRAGVKQF